MQNRQLLDEVVDLISSFSAVIQKYDSERITEIGPHLREL